MLFKQESCQTIGSLFQMVLNKRIYNSQVGAHLFVPWMDEAEHNLAKCRWHFETLCHPQRLFLVWCHWRIWSVDEITSLICCKWLHANKHSILLLYCHAYHNTHVKWWLASKLDTRTTCTPKQRSIGTLITFSLLLSAISVFHWLTPTTNVSIQSLHESQM